MADKKTDAKSISVDDIKKLRAKTSAGIGLCKEALYATDGDIEKAVNYVNERSDVISRLHNETGAKIGLCKIAFEEADKDFKKAVEIINDRDWADETSIQESADAPKEGLIEAYVHGTDQKTVSLAEITTSTDFVAKNEVVREFAHDIALHVAAMKPKYVSREDIPDEKIKEMEELFNKETLAEGKPEKLLPKIIPGKMEKFYKENCLMEQTWLRDDSKTVKNMLDELIGKVGEPVTIRRILCWVFGEKI
ncbi:elongation factor Ts [Candidatus Dojkabacteria bacterium]|nr:elongation factor Ts [Candidatus Dojkabacteria bacterium]